MHQRGISKDYVEACLRDPDKNERLSDDTYRCIKKLNNKVLIVICRKIGDLVLVVTTYTSSKIHKYLKYLT